jgi:antitoxin ParD1/3/4
MACAEFEGFDNSGKLLYSPHMPLDISLTPYFEVFVRQTVKAGRYKSAEELVMAALRLLKERETQRTLRLEHLHREIRKGLESDPGEPLSEEFWQRIRQRLVQRDARQADV